MYTEVTLTDGVETGRSIVKSDIVNAPIDQIITLGNRPKPSATLTAFKPTKKKDKYDISGKFKANAEVVLALDGKRIKRAKTDKNGNFTFKGIKVASTRPGIEIYNRVKGKEAKISEKTTVIDKTKSKLQTDYAKIHPSVAIQSRPIQGKPIVTAAAPSVSDTGCEPNYSPCIKNVSGDLNCPDIKVKVHVIGTDRYHLDADEDGIGCETY